MDTKTTAKAPKTLLEAARYYKDPEVCRTTLMVARWPNGVTCPHCGSKEVTFLANARLWKCRVKHPRQKFSVKVGTVFEDSPIGLDKWLPVAWMLVNCKNGVSSLEIHRAVGVTQKTAWFMLHRLRLAMQDDGTVKLGGGSGIVEVDESWIGGTARLMNAKQRKRHEAKTQGKGIKAGKDFNTKAVVMGMLERGGHVRCAVVPNVQGETLQPHIREHVERGAEVHTDRHGGYTSLGARRYENLGQPDYAHKVVDHAVTYVDGNVHTNGIENFWSLLKRGIRGTYVSVEPFHLFRYIDEQAFRFNTRKGTDASRFLDVLGTVSGKRLTYQALIGAGQQVPHPA